MGRKVSKQRRKALEEHLENERRFAVWRKKARKRRQGERQG